MHTLSRGPVSGVQLDEADWAAIEQAVPKGRRLQARALGSFLRGCAAGLRRAMADIYQRWQRSRRITQTARALNRLDARTLQDIGIGHRSQIPAAARAFALGDEYPAPRAPVVTLAPAQGTSAPGDAGEHERLAA